MGQQHAKLARKCAKRNDIDGLQQVRNARGERDILWVVASCSAEP